MRFAIALTVTATLLLAAASAGAGEWSLADWAKRESPWKGHGVGSYVTEQTTMELPKMPDMPDMPNVPGMPKDGKMVTTTKTTLMGITETGYKLKVETTSMGQTHVTESTEPKLQKSTITVTEAGQGSVTVGGKAYACAIKQVADMGELMGGQVPASGPGGMKPAFGAGKIWEHADLGVLKVETSMNMMGQQATMTWQVSKLAAAVTVGEKTHTGREMTMTTKLPMGTSTVTMVTSRDVPGGSLKREMVGNFMGNSTRSTTVVTEYVKKPLVVTTPAK